ncbi:MAG: glycosyltransferase family 39 protein, partial [Planctomycetota bacterium]
MPALVLVVTGLVLYANSLQGPFVYDDQFAIVENPNILQLWPLSQSLSAPDEAPVAGRPVVCLSLAINYALGGMEVVGYHLFNIVIHILCSLVLLGVVRRTLLSDKLRPFFEPAAQGLAFVCALLWLVHPVQSECVNYITQRTESMMALFYLLTLYCLIRARDSTRPRLWQVSCVAACSLGMACKESMVTAPFMIFVYDMVFLSGSLRVAVARRKVLYAGLASTWILLGWLMTGGPRSESVGFATQVS